MRRARCLVLPIMLFVSVLCLGQVGNSPPSAGSTSGNAQPPQPFDINAAVNAYLAKMPPAQRARSDAYFEGGYWLTLWDFLSTVLVMWLLLHFGWSARMRDLAERITRFRPLQTALYWVQFIIVTSVLGFPLTVYEGYFREHEYGLLNQTFGPLDARPVSRFSGRRGSWRNPHSSAVRAGAPPGRQLVGLGFGSDDRVFCLRESHRSRLHRTVVQPI